MTAIDDRAAQLADQLGSPLTEERALAGGIHYRAYHNGILVDIPGAGVYCLSEATVADRFTADPLPGEGEPMAEIRERIMAEAAAREGTPYALPPDGITTTDCSLYVLDVYAAAGLPFPVGVRTAEQERQACLPIGWDDVQPGDLLFFEHTYEPSEPPGPDGHVASHISISEGAGTQRVWQAIEPAVTESDISTDYWQSRLFEARAHPALFAAATLPPPTATAEVEAVDVSNYQPWAQDPVQLEAHLAALEPEPTRVIVRLASYLEPASLREIAVHELQAADACGLETEAYVWVYAAVDAAREAAYSHNQVMEAMPTSLYAVWLDLEDADAPSLATIRDLVHQLTGYGYTPGIYSGKYYLEEHYPNCPPEFAQLGLWVANYSDAYTIDTVPVPAPWSQAEGWQYTDTPVDRNRFRS